MLLRDWRAGDAPALVNAFGDEQVLRFSWSSTGDYTLADARQYLRNQEAGRRAGIQAEFALADPRDGRLLGGAALYRIDREHGVAAVGYWLTAAARGDGRATTAVLLITQWAFGTLRLARLELTCGPDNTASQRVAARCGFTLEGTLRSHMPFKGTRRDTLLYSLLPTDPQLGVQAPRDATLR